MNKSPVNYAAGYRQHVSRETDYGGNDNLNHRHTPVRYDISFLQTVRQNAYFS